MSAFRPLLKVMFREYYSPRRFLGIGNSKSKGKAIGIAIAIVYALVAMFVSFFFLFDEMAKMLEPMNMLSLLIGFAFTYASGFAVLYVLFRADSFLFHFKDYEIIAPLPVKPMELVLVKVILMMTGLYIMVFLMTSPILAVYFLYTGFDLLKLAIFLIGILFVPLLPTIFFSLAALLLHRVSGFFKNRKLASIFLLTAFTVALIVLSTAMSLSGENFLIGQTNVIEWINRHYPVSDWFVQAVDQADLLKLGGVILLSGVPFALFVLSLPKPVIRLNQTAAVSKPQTYEAAVYESRGVFSSLVRKEWQKFFSVPMYAMNSGIGIVMLLLASIAALIFQNDVTQFLVLPGIPAGSSEIAAIGFSMFCIAMVYTPAVSLSLEGKNFWIVKSLPIEPKMVMKAKIVFNLLLQIPAGIFGAAMLSIAFKVPFVSAMAIVLLIASFALLTSSSFALINLYLPKFDWMNEIEVVKQSLAAIVAIFGSFGLIALTIVGILQFSKLASTPAAILIVTLFVLALALFFLRLVARLAENLFIRMKA